MGEPKIRLDGSKKYAIFDGMTWPMPDHDLAYRLRYVQGDLSYTDRLRAASLLDAYLALVHDPRVKRESVIRALRLAVKQRGPVVPRSAPSTTPEGKDG